MATGSKSPFSFHHLEGLKSLTDTVAVLIRTRLWLQILVSMALGIGVGILINAETGFFSPKAAYAIGEWLALPGQIFLAVIQMIVVPLILASIVRGISAATDIEQLKSTGLWVMVYFFVTTVVAVIIGISVGLLIQPGKYIDAKALLSGPEGSGGAQRIEKIQQQAEGFVATDEKLTLSQMPTKISDILPKNPMSSIVEGEMLEIVIFAIVIGMGLLLLEPKSARPLMELFGSIQEVCMAIVGFVMRLAPVAVFGLLAQAMIKTGPQVLAGLGIYSISVIIGMCVLLVFYVLIVQLLGRGGALNFLKAIRSPLLLGFSTNSSAATMPVTVKSAEEELKVRPSISQFIVPLGATVNMGGTALYQGLATMFMAQMFGIDLPLSALVALVATALGASIGTPAVPGVGIIVLAGVLSSAGVPLTGLTLIVGVDRILERFRTSLNVTGDLAACSVMDRFIREGSPSRSPESGSLASEVSS